MLTALFALLLLAMMVGFFGTDADNQLQGGAEEEGRFPRYDEKTGVQLFRNLDCSCDGDTKDLSDALKCLSDALNGDSSSRRVIAELPVCPVKVATVDSILRVIEALENHPLVIGMGYWSCCPSAVAVMEEDGWHHRDESGDCDSKVKVFRKDLPKDFFSDSKHSRDLPTAQLGSLFDHINKYDQMVICGMIG